VIVKVPASIEVDAHLLVDVSFSDPFSIQIPTKAGSDAECKGIFFVLLGIFALSLSGGLGEHGPEAHRQGGRETPPARSGDRVRHELLRHARHRLVCDDDVAVPAVPHGGRPRDSGTLNVGHTLPTVAQAFIYTLIIQVDFTTLVR
jgi:hypothetical protein